MPAVSARRPLWFYGIMCLVVAVVPNMISGPPANAEAAASRFTGMIVLTAVGFAILGWSAVQTWRRRQKQ